MQRPAKVRVAYHQRVHEGSVWKSMYSPICRGVRWKMKTPAEFEERLREDVQSNLLPEASTFVTSHVSMKLSS